MDERQEKHLPLLDRVQAIATCAILMPFFFASSSTLSIRNRQGDRNANPEEGVPVDDFF